MKPCPACSKPAAPVVCDYQPLEEDFVYHRGNHRPLNQGGWFQDLYHASDGRWWFCRFEMHWPQARVEETNAEEAERFLAGDEQWVLIGRHLRK